MEIFLMALRAVLEVFFLALGVAFGMWGYEKYLTNITVSITDGSGV